MRIFVDVDDVLHDLVTQWLALYNADYADAITVHDITSWNITDFVKPECGNQLYAYLRHPSIFQKAVPDSYAQKVIQRMKQAGHRVYALSSCVPGTLDAKCAWVDTHFGIPFIACRDKYLLNGDLLIDDGVHNAAQWRGDFLLYDKPWNRLNQQARRVRNWKEIEEFLFE